MRFLNFLRLLRLVAKIEDVDLVDSNKLLMVFFLRQQKPLLPALNFDLLNQFLFGNSDDLFPRGIDFFLDLIDNQITNPSLQLLCQLVVLRIFLRGLLLAYVVVVHELEVELSFFEF